MSKCEHKNFHANINVIRFEDRPEKQADIQIKCCDCQTRFRFLGLPVGMNFRGACVSADGREARLAIVEQDKTLEQIGGVSGFSVRITNAP